MQQINIPTLGIEKLIYAIKEGTAIAVTDASVSHTQELEHHHLSLLLQIYKLQHLDHMVFPEDQHQWIHIGPNYMEYFR